jgi:hypothetical protein
VPPVLEAVSPSGEDWSVSVVGQSYHIQHERLLPTLASTPVTITSPTRNEITAAIRLPNRIERRLLGERERGGKDKTVDKDALNLPRMPLRENSVVRNPLGTLTTFVEARAR